MAFVVGKDDKDKKNPMDVLSSPGSFRNIKQQLQQEQINQAIQPVHQAPLQERKEDQERRFFNGGVARKQHFEEGDIVEIEGEGAGGGYRPKKQVQQGAGFVNIQDYLAANKGRAEAIGEKVAGDFEQEAGDINQSIQDTQEEYTGAEGKYGSDSESFIDETIAGAGEDTLSEEDQSKWDDLRDTSKAPTAPNDH